MNRRRVLIFAALAATLFLVWRVSQDDDGPPAADLVAARTPRTVPAGQSQPGPVPSATVPVRGLADANPFPVQSWRPPPPPPPPAAPPPPPSPPPLPFTYLGAWQEGGRQIYFFSQGGGEFGLHLGGQNGPWRLDTAGPDQLVFSYLPMNMQRTMRLSP